MREKPIASARFLEFSGGKWSINNMRPGGVCICAVYTSLRPLIFPAAKKTPRPLKNSGKIKKGGATLTQQEILQELHYPLLLKREILKKQKQLEQTGQTYIKARPTDITGIHSHFRGSTVEGMVFKLEELREEIFNLYAEQAAAERIIQRRINRIPNEYYSEKRYLEYNFVLKTRKENRWIAQSAGRKLQVISQDAIRLYAQAAAKDEQEQEALKD